MVRVVVIGGSGHIGSYLVPHLVERDYEVINVSRGTASPYRPHRAWSRVRQISADRKAEDASGTFGTRIAELDADIVVDIIAFEVDSAVQVVEALRERGTVQHYLFASTLWVYGHLTAVPCTESEPLFPIDEYGRKKVAIEEYLMRLARLEGFPATSFRPGHIVGEGWIPINPQGHQNPDVYTTIANGGELLLPNLGLEMLHHVHADDLARWVLCAIDNRQATIGECFNTVSSQSLTMKGYAQAMYRYFGQQPRLAYAPLDEFQKEAALSDVEFRGTTSHVTHSPCASIEKSRVRLGYQPRYTSLEAVQQSVDALIADGRVTVAKEEGKAQ